VSDREQPDHQLHIRQGRSHPDRPLAAPTSPSIALANQTARGSDTFSYDQANRLTNSTVANLGATSAYDGDGKRGPG
jgi:hypothetical protein